MVLSVLNAAMQKAHMFITLTTTERARKWINETTALIIWLFFATRAT
jgi:hypothetical protein